MRDNTTICESAGQYVAILDALRGEMPLSDFRSLVREGLAAFLLLRFAELQDSEHHAMVVFEGPANQPLVAAALAWRDSSGFTSPGLLADQVSKLARHLEALWSDVGRPVATCWQALSSALHRISELDSACLAELVRWVGQLPMETVTERRLSLELFDRALVETFASEQSVFAVRADVSSLMVALGNPRTGERVYDPCFCEGSLLIAAWKYANRGQIDQRRPDTQLDMAGAEFNSGLFLIGFTRILLAGIENPRLEYLDIREQERPIASAQESFDLVLSSPPVRASSRPHPRRNSFTSHLDNVGLYVNHALSHLKSGGRAVIVVPEEFLFRRGYLREFRRSLVEGGHVEAIVALPSETSQLNAGMPVCLLVLRKNGGANRIRMADANALGIMLRRRYGDKTQAISQVIAEQLAAELRHLELRRPIKGQEEDTPDRGLISRVTWEVVTSELEATDWDLTPRRRSKGDLEKLLLGLQGAFGEAVSIACLSEVAEISLGRSVSAKDLLKTPPSDHSVGYVRIRDLSHGKVLRVSGWLRPELALTESHRVLRPNDVLVSKSGTIGKSAVVPDTASGSVAGSGLYIVRTDPQRLDPGFLQAYLASPLCKNWLAAQSRGAAIQHLNREVLDRLPVLVPPLPIQVQAAAHFRELGADALAFLTNGLGPNETERLTVLLAALDQEVPKFFGDVAEMPPLNRFELVAFLVREVSERAENALLSSDAALFLSRLSEALLPLSGVSQIPPGPGLLHVLREAERGLLVTLEQATDDLPEVFPARGAAERLCEWLRASINDLNENVGLKVRASPASLVAGSFAEFSVELENSGPLPLRELQVETQPDWGCARTPYLVERDAVEVKLRGDVPESGQDLSVRLLWHANTLLGKSVRGEIELAIRLTDPEQTSGSVVPELGANPYVTGDPLGPGYGHDLFYGREELIGQIGRQVGTHGNVVLLEGNRRTGKTSILNHLAGRTAIPGWLAVYASLQGTEGSEYRAGVPTAEVFRAMARGIATGLTKLSINIPLPNGQVIPPGAPGLGVARACAEGIGADSPFADFLDYLEVVLAALEHVGLGLLLMFDEFDKLQVGIDNGVTSPQVPENIRFLIQSNPRFSAILTGSRRLKRLREEYWSALYGLGTSIPVTALDEASARKVVTEPVRDQLAYSQQAVDAVLEVTARHPYLMQCLCSRIFEDAFRTGARSITYSAVIAAVTSLVRDNEHFATLWDYAGQGPDTGGRRRHLILLLCARSLKQGTHIDFGLLHELLAQEGVEVEDESLDVDLSHLRELELVDFRAESGDGHYSLSIPMMAEWIEQTQDAKVIASRARTEAEEENV